MEQFISDNLFSIIGFVSMLVGLYITSDKTQAVFKNELGHIKEDVARLERKQEESNRLKERMVVQEFTSEAQWKRIDEMRAELDDIKKSGQQ